MAKLTETNHTASTPGIRIDKVEIEIIDGIEYKLFHNERGPAFRVLDIAGTDADGNNIGEVVGLTNFKSEAKAGATFDAAVAYARKVA